jgi:drug/metabolite transporter (DMT)-like permease
MTGSRRRTPAATATALLVASALGFSTIAIFTTLATRAGVPLVTVLAGRYVFAFVVLVPAAGGLSALRLEAGRALRLAAVGGALQAAIGFLSLSALAFIPAATVVFLFYTFPIWVAVLAFARHSERLTPVKMLALALSLMGVAAMVGLPGAEAVHPAGAALALSAAFAYAVFIPTINRLQTGLNSTVATAWLSLGAALIFLSVGSLGGQLSTPFPAVAVIHIVALGVISTALALVLFLKGLAVLGPLRTAIITTAEPFFVAILAALVLAQPIRAATVVGGSLIAVAVLRLHWRPGS